MLHPSKGCVPNAINESLPTQHYNLQITVHITVTDNNSITVTGLTNACGANQRALHWQCTAVTPFRQQFQLEDCPEICSPLCVIYRCLSCIRLCVTSVVWGGGGACERSGDYFPHVLQLNPWLTVPLCRFLGFKGDSWVFKLFFLLENVHHYHSGATNSFNHQIVVITPRSLIIGNTAASAIVHFVRWRLWISKSIDSLQEFILCMIARTCIFEE